MNFTIWYSTESMADFIIDNTILSQYPHIKKILPESDASKPQTFHKVPDHLKKILYLDSPDIIVELDREPIFSMEDSKEAGTGHNAFQRFSRLAASAENKIPTFYLYPEAAVISRQNASVKWDEINPSIFKALNRLMDIYRTPALLFYYPSFYRDKTTTDIQTLPNKGLKLNSNIRYAGCPTIDVEIRNLFNCINDLVNLVIEKGVLDGINSCLSKISFSERREFHNYQYSQKNPNQNILSPITSTIKVPTKAVINYINQQTNILINDSILQTRSETIIYKINAKFRGDPYPGALAALDYLCCREGKTFEDRQYNLVMAWGDVNYIDEKITIYDNGNRSINNFFNDVKSCETKNLLTKNYKDLPKKDIPRYYMQARYGSMFSKNKHIRIYSYFCDAILFADGVLWRDG